MRLIAIVAACIILASCSTLRHTKKEVLDQSNEIASLQERIDNGIKEDIHLLAPLSFAEAQKLLDEAIDMARRSEDKSAGTEVARKGLAQLNNARNVAHNSRQILADALKRRAQAKKAQADQQFSEEFSKLDSDLSDAAKALETGNQKEGLEKNVVLANSYATLESRSLKINIAEIASQAYQQALASNAQKLAPITLAKAKNELDIAKRIIEVEKTNYEKAQFHAESARYLSMRAKYIAEIVTGFKKEKLSEEQIVLWYQDQLQEAYNPLNKQINFDLRNKDVIAALANQLAASGSNVKALKEEISRAEEEAASLSSQMASREEQLKAQEERLHTISYMFTPDEAEVLRRDDDIIIRSHGFQFNVGKAELLQSNYDLLNKIVAAINKYPGAHIVVEGHTDSTGSKNLNLKLSGERAKNIADFLIKVAQIDKHLVSSIGIGEERPIASNTSAEGRAKNRRIEVIIRNS